ncbi:hypothetical protein EZV73_15925 [Acidaminobacter sp. JC074]|uniref:hypothetical protein n=1 Tax=Acidaminobacter sp. JC074 TaxID=2530199 RepID=UPI001F10EC9C|nr:hypothetical protein [Acidaminobacter sp. JC074]MCH4889084.1 hypothetical protein [Acidaminobacter sp. JC074]
MFAIAIIIVLAAMIFATGGGLAAILDIPSVIIPLAITLVVLAGAGLFRDFFRAIKISVERITYIQKRN